MTPWRLEQLVQKCGKWIYSADTDHGVANPSGKNRLWLAPSVLTPKNPDKTNPQITLDDATEVFDALQKRRLLTTCVLEVTDTQGAKREATVFLVNREMKEEWDKLATKSGFLSMKASPVIYYFFGSENPWAWLIFVFILAAFFGELLKNLADSIYWWLKSLVFP